MTFQGDLATIDMAALLQNLESHLRTGTLSIEGAQGTTQLLFREGRIVALGRDGRAPLMQALVSSGAVTRAQVNRAARARRGSMGERLIFAGAITEEALLEAARARLVDDVCELVTTEAGEFAFHRGGMPPDVFDPEEQRLELALPAGPMLLEAARRSDHWAQIRTWIPADDAHLAVQRRPELPEDAASRALCDALLEKLDGTRSVDEVAQAFGHQRFETYKLLADWLKARCLRTLGPEEMLRLAQRLGAVEPDRALAIVERGLQDAPRHLELLGERAHLAESLDRTLEAVEALKLAVHVELAAEDRESAWRDLERARALAPLDYSVWERSLEMALAEGDARTAREIGASLAELYREPGLHRRARRVWAALAELEPDAWEPRRELSRSKIDCADVEEAIADLEGFAERCLATADDAGAREVYQEILEHIPDHSAARDTIAKIDGSVFAERRARRRRRLRLAAASGILVLVGWGLTLEFAARRAYSAAQRSVSELGLIEQGDYAAAIAAFEQVRTAHAWTPTVLFDVRAKLADLRSRADNAPGDD